MRNLDGVQNNALNALDFLMDYFGGVELIKPLTTNRMSPISPKKPPPPLTGVINEAPLPVCINTSSVTESSWRLKDAIVLR